MMHVSLSLEALSLLADYPILQFINVAYRYNPVKTGELTVFGELDLHSTLLTKI